MDEIENLITKLSDEKVKLLATCKETRATGNAFAAYTELCEVRNIGRLIEALKIIQSQIATHR